ncbi:MAG: hypothetical protein JWP57_2043 [Spirosoma sp.]|nr:hypothetical protein [Spirosoma sp.]
MDQAKRIGDHAKESEELIRPHKEAFEAEEKRQKEEAAKAEAARLSARINSLNVLGATFDGASYNVHGVYIDAIEVKALPDDEFRDLLDSATTAYNAEQTRLAQIEEQRQQEAARLEQQRQEQEAERIRLKNEADELRAKQDELDQKQRDFEAQQSAKLLADRIATLQAVGLVDDQTNRICYPGYDWHFTYAELLKLTDIEVDQAVHSAKMMNEQREAEARQDAIDKAEQERYHKQAEADKKKADKARQKRLEPDKARLVVYVNNLLNMPRPELTEPEAQVVSETLWGFLNVTATDMREEIKSL